MMKANVRFLAYAAILAALYVLLALLQELILPGSGSLAIQFRAAEALCVFALFTPAAIPGLTLGCLLFNLISAGALPLDFLIGSAATLLSTLSAYLLRRVRLGKLPLASLLMPALFNGVLVGMELWLFLGELPLWLSMLYVAAGEAAVMLSLGTALYFACSSRRFDERFFGR